MSFSTFCIGDFVKGPINYLLNSYEITLKGEGLMENYLLISDAAKEVHVESHVLRYWEEELHLPIRRNELGHRYYTREDVERFKQIKGMKERGLQLKAIKMILKDGKLDVLIPEDEKKYQEQQVVPERQDRIRTSQAEEEALRPRQEIAIDIIDNHETGVAKESKEDKSRRLQWLLQQLIREALQENNRDLSREIKDSIVKELDYQFRCQEEREEEREQKQIKRNEEYYQRMDELLRKKSRLRKQAAENKTQAETPVMTESLAIDDKIKEKEDKRKQAKRKRHSFF